MFADMIGPRKSRGRSKKNLLSQTGMAKTLLLITGAIASSYCNTVTRSVATTEFFHFNGTLTTPWGSVEVKERNALPTNDPGVLR